MLDRSERQNEVLRIVRTHAVRTQTELVLRLHRAGYDCTQASVSRDIRALGLTKRKGQYVGPVESGTGPTLEQLAMTTTRYLRSVHAVGEHLLVLRTPAGTANSVALYIDGAGWPGLVGTVAGDDTIFAAVSDRRAGAAIRRRLQTMIDAEAT